MKLFLAFGLMMAVILLGLGLWTATPQGGGGLGEEGGAGQDLQDREQGASPGVIPQDRDGVAQDNSDGRVEIRDGAVAPSSIEVTPRSVVTFLNRDDVAREVEFADQKLPGAEIRPGGAHTVEVPATGRFPFTIGGDDAVTGTLVVRPN